LRGSASVAEVSGEVVAALLARAVFGRPCALFAAGFVDRVFVGFAAGFVAGFVDRAAAVFDFARLALEPVRCFVARARHDRQYPATVIRVRPWGTLPA